MHTTLYRLYNADDELIYVGVAGNPGRRFEQHRGDKPWWGEVVRIEVEHFATREAALEAERVTIASEHPPYNVIHKPKLTVVAKRLVWTCQGCGDAIGNGEGGLHVIHEDVHRHREWSRSREGGGFEPIDLSNFVPAAPWLVFHDECASDPRSVYFIDVERIRTFEDVIYWTAHLLESKSWLPFTDWHRLLYSLQTEAE